jgi:hypothetical protein
MAAMLLPALSSAGVKISVANVSVIDRKTVGIYETATLSSRNGEALLTWLNQNGFATPTNFVPAIRAYAEEGWYFVVSKVRLDLPMSESAQPHPLAFAFKTDHPVYPLRLTGIGNEKCRIDLYVFGPDRASVPNFKVERCTKPEYPVEDVSRYWPQNVLRIRHPLLRTLVNHAPVATKLTAELTSQQMEKDGYLQWTPFQEKRKTLYTNHGAVETASDLSVPLLILALVLWYAFKNCEDPWAKRFCGICSVAALAGLLAWPAIYLSLPKTPAFSTRIPGPQNETLHEQLAGMVSLEAARNHKDSHGFTPNLAWVRQQLSGNSEFRKALPSSEQMNFFTGQPIHEEDSPGNFTLSESPAGILYTWYDIDGGANIIDLSDEAAGAN